MKTYRLDTTSQFLHPLWFNKVRHGTFDVVVLDNGRVLLEGEELSIRDDAIEPGEAVKVWINQSGFFTCALVADIERDKIAAADAKADAVEVERAKRNAIRDAAIQFNSTLSLPVQWTVGIKDVLSGLSETSWGDGRNKATVEHVYLLDDLSVGRLQRQKGDFLCTAKTGNNGLRFSNIIESWNDGDGKPFTPQVTCKKCLSIAMRFDHGLPPEANASEDATPSP